MIFVKFTIKFQTKELSKADAANNSSAENISEFNGHIKVFRHPEEIFLQRTNRDETDLAKHSLRSLVVKRFPGLLEFHYLQPSWTRPVAGVCENC